MNKKILAGIAIILLVLPIVSALDLKMYDENGAEDMIFSPGSIVVFRAEVSEDVDTVTLVILKDNNPILTDRMKIFSLKPKEFAYGYEIQENMEQGDYIVKVLAKGDTTESMSKEMYIGQEVQLSFVEPNKADEELAAEELSFFQRLWRFIKNLFVKNE
jgi:hypothetical protein